MNGPRWPYLRAPDISDLRTRECWICKEDETFSERAQQKKESVSKWIHPCKCTLVAHESCLLEWIARTQQSLDPPPQCPQCNTPFELATKRGLVLRCLDWLDSRKGTVVSALILTGFTGGFLILSTTYGVHALRLLVGKEMCKLMIGESPSEWPFEAWVNLPLIPFALMTTQTSRLDPFLLSLPFLASPYLHLAEHPAGSLTSSPLLPSISHAREPISPLPPSPSLLIALLPLVKFTYSSLRQHMIRLLLAPGHRGRGGALGIADVDAGPEIREEFGLRVQVEDQNGNQQNWARGLVLNGTTVGTFVTYSLSLPIIASLSGRALRWVADYSATLRKFLAIDAHLIPNMYRPAARIGFLGLRAPIGVTDLDPIWWRNAVGLCLFTVTKDAVALFHAWSRREEKRTRRIVSRDFAGLDLQGLDLIV